MNKINEGVLKEANAETILNMSLEVVSEIEGSALPNGRKLKDGDTLGELVKKFSYYIKTQKSVIDKTKLEELENQCNILNSILDESNEFAYLKDMQIGNRISKKGGLKACTFTAPNGDVSVVFGGTGASEWIDNGIGLSGIPEENTYVNYGENGRIDTKTTIKNDYATDQQVEALNWFNKIASENGWNKDTHITVSGHSKGGNKAQFITINSDLVDECFSLDGQGFSPEAVLQFKDKYGDKYEERRKKIFSISSYNDYVNVLGERIVPEDQIYYFKSPMGDKNAVNYHKLEALLGSDGKLNDQCEQGEISEYIENVSCELMQLVPEYRQAATLTIMNLCQKYLGRREALNDKEVTPLTMVAGIIVTLEPLILTLLGTKEGHEAIVEFYELYGNDDNIKKLLMYFEKIQGEYDNVIAGYAVLVSISGICFTAPFLTYTNMGKILNDMYNLYLIKKWAGNSIAKLSKKLKEINVDIYISAQRFLTSTINYIENYFNNSFHPANRNLAYDIPLRVDTSKLRVYADKLEIVNNRLRVLNQRIDNLYLKVGLRDLFNLLQADLLMGPSWQISNCIRYLNETANDFEVTERNISGLF